MASTGPASSYQNAAKRKTKKHKGPSAKDSAMPYDAQYQDALEQLIQQRTLFHHELIRQAQMIKRQFISQQRDINQQKPYAFTSLRNGYAGRGMAHSSGYGGAFRDLDSAYLRQLQQLREGRNLQVGQLTGGYGYKGNSQWQDYLQNYNTQLDLLRKAANRRVSQSAGDLGLKA